MTDNLRIEEVSFADEIVEYFLYSAKDKRLEMGFDAFYCKDDYVESSCVLILESWKQAFSKVCGGGKISDLEEHLGIAGLVLSLEKNDGKVKMTLNTLDGRYIELTFVGVEARVEVRDDITKSPRA